LQLLPKINRLISIFGDIRNTTKSFQMFNKKFVQWDIEVCEATDYIRHIQRQGEVEEIWGF
jgi:hypothetical protein